MNMNATPSECKMLDEKNNSYFKRYSQRLKNDPRVSFVDTNIQHWQNDSCTIVIEVKFDRMFEAMNFVNSWCRIPDEFHMYQKDLNTFYIRMWWD